MMRILITGATGFVGGHLAELLLAQGVGQLYCVGRSGRWPPDLVHLRAHVDLRACDLRNGAEVIAMLRDVAPDQIYHLAGYTSAGRSFREPEEAWNGNLTATRRLYESCLSLSARPRILFVGSGLVYETPPDSQHAHHELCPLMPVSPYAASKAAADLASYQFSRAAGLHIVRARPFNHVGPRQATEFAIAHFAQQIAAIEQGRQAPLLQTGNLAPQRDFTDVRDVVRAHLLLMQRGQPGEVYNVATGSAIAMESVVNQLLAMARTAIEVSQQPDLVRATEVLCVRGDAGRLCRQTGWTPTISFEQTLADTLEYWRRKP
jgi:GDP-4-dehydro-6-deoxy-D-mannose reductase